MPKTSWCIEMSSAAPFLFNTDFREDRRAKAPSEADIADIRARALAEGRAEGQAEARAALEADLIGLASQLLAQADAMLADQDTRAAQIEDAATRLAVAFAQKLSSIALAQRPLAEIEAAARQCMVHARSAPHLAIRVAEGMVADVDRLFARITREIGYSGKVVVLGEPDMAPSQARMEWADGGLVIDPAAREAALEAAVARALGTSPSPPDRNQAPHDD
jgi:flagellar assembly protein FliH